MSELKLSTEVIAFFSILYREDVFSSQASSKDELVNLIQKEFQLEKLALKSCDFYPMKKYYAKEMGDESLLKRDFIFSTERIPRERLVELKIIADKVEKKFMTNNARSINIDPGYIALEQVVLSTGKPYSHRIYQRNGVYLELTYEFKDNSFKPLPWTYPDYCNEEIIHLFNYMRGLNLS